MKIKNISNLPVQVHDEHAGRGALVDPGAEVELSEQAGRELLEHTAVWAPVTVEKPAVRMSGRATKKES